MVLQALETLFWEEIFAWSYICNDLVAGPGLFIKKKLYLSSFIPKSYMLQFQLLSLSLQLSPSYPLDYLSTLAHSGAEILCVVCEPLQIKENAWVQVHKDSLQINAFPDLVVLKQEKKTHALQRKATERAKVSGERDG